jgi:glycosyltransferase involved in cell wall biosynthesis
MKKAILFAGRPNAKGLEHVIQAVAASDWHLHLAGPSRLDEIAKQTLLHSQYTYHGALNSPELFELLHQVQAVAVLSECFDVFPTITIEALRHGTLVITTLNTGNSDLVRKISKDLLIHYSKIPKLVALDEVFQSFYKNSSDSDWSASLLTSVEDSYNSYLRNHLNPN